VRDSLRPLDLADPLLGGTGLPALGLGGIVSAPDHIGLGQAQAVALFHHEPAERLGFRSRVRHRRSQRGMAFCPHRSRPTVAGTLQGVSPLRHRATRADDLGIMPFNERWTTCMN
jgi:hypothetical protein